MVRFKRQKEKNKKTRERKRERGNEICVCYLTIRNACKVNRKKHGTDYSNVHSAR